MTTQYRSYMRIRRLLSQSCTFGAVLIGTIAITIISGLHSRRRSSVPKNFVANGFIQPDFVTTRHPAPPKIPYQRNCNNVNYLVLSRTSDRDFKTFQRTTSMTTTVLTLASAESETRELLLFERQNSTKRTRQPNLFVRKIMSMLISRYDSAKQLDPFPKSWKKTRAYLYYIQDRVDQQIVNEEQILDVLTFLDDELGLPTDVSRSILQEYPRVLRRPVKTFLRPTSNFLQKRWGGELFIEGLRKRPDLILTSGIGYDPLNKIKVRETTANKSTQNDSVTLPIDEGSDNEQFDDKCDRIVENDKEGRIEGILSQRCLLSSTAIEKLKETTPHLFSMKSKRIHGFIDVLEETLSPLHRNTTTSMAERKVLSAKIIGKVIQRYPSIVGLIHLKIKIEYLSFTLGLTDVDVARMLRRCYCSILAPSISFLKAKIELFVRVILMRSNAIDESTTSLSDRDQQVLEARDEQKYDEAIVQLRKILLRDPVLLTCSNENIMEKVDYFRSIDDDNGDLAARLLIKNGSIYLLSLEDNIKPKVDFLRKIWGCTVDDYNDGQGGQNVLVRNMDADKANAILSKMFSENPPMLSLSLDDNIKPTVQFFNQTGYISLNEDWELINDQNDVNSVRLSGRLIAASLFKRLIPRWTFCSIINDEMATQKESEALQKPNLITDDSDVTDHLPEPKRPALFTLALMTDKDFCDNMGFDYDKFSKFMLEEAPKISFNRQFGLWIETGRPIKVE